RVSGRCAIQLPEEEGPGEPAARPRDCLPLLPSGPDGVHKLGLRWAWPRKIGGDDRIRTDDPLVANEVLSQLSYIPTCHWKLGRWSSAPVMLELVPHSSSLLKARNQRQGRRAWASRKPRPSNAAKARSANVEAAERGPVARRERGRDRRRIVRYVEDRG